jgi:hypothetical protein
VQDRQWLVALGIGLVFVFGVTIVSLYVGFSLGRSTVEDRTVISPNIRVNPTHVSVQPPNVEVYPQNLEVSVKPPSVEVQVRELTDDLGMIAKSVAKNEATLKELQELTTKTLKEVVIQGKAGSGDVKAEVRRAIEAQLVKPPVTKEQDPDGNLIPPPKGAGR